MSQIVISGQVSVSSRLAQHLELRILTHKTVPKEANSILGAGQTSPSYIVEYDNLRAIRIRLMGLKTLWSQEVPVSGEKMKETRLVKVSVHIVFSLFCRQS